MKKVLLPFFLLTFILAGSTFWQKVLEIQKALYSNYNQSMPKANDTNSTLEAGLQDASSIVDKRVGEFNQLIMMLKEAPYEVKNENNPFYNPKEAKSKRAKLLARVAVNREYGYTTAVLRDNIALKNLELKGHIYDFFVNLADNWTSLEENRLKEIIEKERVFLKLIPLDEFKAVYDNSLKSTDKISSQIVSNYERLKVNVDFYSDFLDYLDSNPSLLHYRSFAALFKLDQIIEQINEIEVFAKANIYLRYIWLDMGRVLIFTLIMFIAWGASFLLYYRIYGFLKKQILKSKDAIDDLLLSNLDGIRKPLYLLVLAFGFEIGLEVLLYPLPMPEDLSFLFYAVYISIAAYIIIKAIDSLFFDYLIKQSELKNAQMRQELVNLVLSILKITVITIAVFMLLVKMGVNITGLLASLGIGGLAIALAAQNTLSNFFGLLKIIFDNSFSQGDWIETKDIEGTVVEIGFISTFIRTFDNALITVPNSTLANTPLKNWSKRSIGRRIKMHIGVTYGSKREDLIKAIDEIKQMLKNHPGIATEEKIDELELKQKSKKERKLVSTEDKYGVKTTLLVYLDEFSDSSVNILIYAFSKTINWKEWLELKQDVLLKIWEILQRNNLEFAFPSKTVYFDKENIKDSLFSNQNLHLVDSKN